MSHPNADRIRAAYAALERGDLDAAFADFSQDLVLHSPAELPYDPGERRGPDAVRHLFGAMLQATNGRFRNEVLDVLGADDMVVALNRVSVERGGQARTYDVTWVYRLAGGKFVEAWLHAGLDPADLREFFSQPT